MRDPTDMLRCMQEPHSTMAGKSRRPFDCLLQRHRADGLFEPRSRFRCASGVPRNDAPQPAAVGARLRLRRRPLVRWIDVYVVGLLLLILAYYNGLLWTWCELLRLVVVLPDAQRWISQPLSAVGYAAFLMLAIPSLWRLGRHIGTGVSGLVTTRFDDPTESSDEVRLPADEFPQLHQLVHSVARRIDAPAPDRILLSPFAECYVTERRRFSLATDRELLLVLGLPHLSVLLMSELEVILGHELAHLRGGDTIMGVFVFRFLESLRTGMEENRARRWRWCDPLFWLERAYFSAFVRLAAPLRRRQELAADQISADAFGGPLAVQTLLKEWLLAHQFDAEMAALHKEPDPGPMGGRDATVYRASRSTVFSRFTERWRGLTPAGELYLEQRLAEEERTGVFDSHPAMAARIATMRRFGPRPGRNATPARVLLEDQLASLEQMFHDKLLAATVPSSAITRPDGALIESSNPSAT